jgi:hypothetical protein
MPHIPRPETRKHPGQAETSHPQRKSRDADEKQEHLNSHNKTGKDVGEDEGKDEVQPPQERRP